VTGMLDKRGLSLLYIANECPTVLLQAMKQEPPLDAKCRDKFLVQSVTVTPDKEFANPASIVCRQPT
jgi:hypothetical protein